MKRLKKGFMPAVLLAIFAFTGAFAAEPQDDSVKPGTEQMETKKEPQSEERKTGKPRSPSDQGARMQLRQEKEKVINEFMRSLRAAEHKFNEDKRAASKLPPEQRRAATQKAAEEMKASIKKAEESRDAALEKIDPDRKKHKKKKKDRDKRKREKAENTVKTDKAEPPEGQLKPDTENAKVKK